MNAIELQPKRKKETLIKPQSSGIVERCLVVGGGLTIAYTCAATLPIASAAAIGFIALHFWKEIQNFQTPEKSKELELILHSKTVKHPSIYESRLSLKKSYPVSALNRAIESMIGNCDWYGFKPSDDHPLAKFGECYCYKHPHTGKVSLPLHALLEMLQEWEIEPTVTVKAESIKDEPLAIESSTDQPELDTRVVTSPELPQIDLLDVPKLIVDEMYSYAIIAPSGGGKGMLISNVIREYKKRYPNNPVVLIDPKADPKEAKYWDGAVDIWHKINFRKLEIEEKSAWLNEALDIIRGIEGPHLAILDECTMTFGFAKNSDSHLMNRLRDYTTSTASGGNSAEEFLFLMGHSGNLADYGISGGQMSSFRKIYIAPASNKEQIAQLGSTNFTGGKFGEDKLNEIVSIAGESPVNRAVYIGTRNQWFPMAQLENHSGYDRDSRTFLNPPVNHPNDIEDKASQSDTVVQEFTPVDIELEMFIRTLAKSLSKAQQAGKDLEAITPEKLLSLPAAKKINLDLSQAETSLIRAKQLL